MSATIFDSAFPNRERPAEWAPPTTDLESTTDLHEENTKDLAPATDDIKPPAAAEQTGDDPSPPVSTRLMKAELAPVEPTVAPVAASPEPSAAAVEPRKLQRVAQPSRPAALAPGAILCDRYLLEQVIGCGGTAIVYRARDMQSSTNAAPYKEIAIKTPRPELAHDAAGAQRAAARLKHEFQHARALSHPSIVRVFDLHNEPQHCFMTMELIEGKPLPELLGQWKTLPPPVAHRILESCARALSHAHSRDVVHGDFKPGNVFVMPDDSAKVVDFGAAAAPSIESSRIPAGTPAYASPEVLSGATPDRRDDVFSFACVAYELLTGQHPFERRSSLQAREDGKIPPRVWSLSTPQWLALLTALSWQREQRPTDVEAVLKALKLDASSSLADTATIDISSQDIGPPAELPPDLMPPQRSWGFFVFVACALAITFIASQRRGEPAITNHTPMSQAPLGAMPPMSPAMSKSSTTATSTPAAIKDDKSEAPPPKASAESTPASSTAPAPAAASSAPVAAKPRTAAANLSDVSFESRWIETSESSVAAVFLIKRSQPLRGRVRVQWDTVSGSADAGIDFASNAAGSIEFADGQAQRAIYVPLRNDLLKEDDESFTVRLLSPQQGRLGTITRMQATIRDDD